MIEVVRSIDAYHDYYVSMAVKRIQSNGYSVTKIEQVKSMTLLVFGNDVTHIHYKK